MKDRFVLISRWQLDCRIEDAWQRICAIRQWPQWWPNVRAIRAQGEDGATPKVGDIADVDWATRLGYGIRLHVTTTGVLPPFELEGSATGDLVGKGLWALESQPDRVSVTYRWDVHLNRPWMRWCAPLLRPLFAWNHFDIMRAGARGMARSLGCQLMQYQDYTFSPDSAEDLRALRWPENQPGR